MHALGLALLQMNTQKATIFKVQETEGMTAVRKVMNLCVNAECNQGPDPRDVVTYNRSPSRFGSE